jgi:hypothetical protein
VVVEIGAVVVAAAAGLQLVQDLLSPPILQLL